MLYLHDPQIGKAKKAKKFPSISVVVPVYNSKNTIKKCISSLKKIKYPKKVELIIVDDGSTDGTREYLRTVKGITLVELPKNSGAAAATNAGLKKTRTELVACIDSDSYPEENVFMKTIGYFEEKKTGAVTCLVVPDERKKIVEKVQFFEYLSSFGLNNSLLSSIESTYVTPGPMTIFRRKLFEKIGYFTEDNLTQDMEMGLRLKQYGMKIMVCAEAVVKTDVPKNWLDLFKQRDRWYRGGVSNFITKKDLMFNKKNPDFGFFVMPFMFFSQILGLALIIRVGLMFLETAHISFFIWLNYILLGGIPQFHLEMLFFSPILLFFAVVYSLIIAYFLLSFYFTKKYPRISDLPVLIILIFIYPYLITLMYARGYFKEMIGVKAKWVRVST